MDSKTHTVEQQSLERFSYSLSQFLQIDFIIIHFKDFVSSRFTTLEKLTDSFDCRINELCFNLSFFMRLSSNIIVILEFILKILYE